MRARLTQESLAEAAGLSPRSIRDIERGGTRAPRSRTVERLAAALGLSPDERDAFRCSSEVLFWTGRMDDQPADPAARVEADQDEPTGVAEPPDNVGGQDEQRVRPGAASGERRPLRQLPADVGDFVGREPELATLRDTLVSGRDGRRLVAISGPPGVGKTALAVHIAHQVAPQFPDGHVFIRASDLSGGPRGAAEVSARLLRLLGVSGPALPPGMDERTALLRTHLSGRRALVVVDDVAGHGDVEPLLPPEGVAMVVTSRPPLTGLPGVTSVDLAPLPPETGIALLSEVTGTRRVRDEPVAARELVTVCGGLPLALRIVAARLAARPHWTIATLTQRLADERIRLDELRHGDLAVRPQLQLAYEGLTPPARRAFALLGGFRVPSVPEWAVTALLDVDPDRGTTALEELLDARLVDSVGVDQAGQSRIRLHEVTRLYARECRDRRIGTAEWTKALSRIAAVWLGLARHAHRQLRCERLHLDDPDHPAAVADPGSVAVAENRPVDWFEAERETLGALVGLCAEVGLAATARCLAGCATDFYASRAYYDDWRRTTQAALAACVAAGDRLGQAAMTRSLGACLVETDHPDDAMRTLRTARSLAVDVDDTFGAAAARKDFGFALALTGRLDEAEDDLRAAAEELAEIGDPTSVIALCNLAFVQQQRGDVAAALTTSNMALRMAKAGGSRIIEAFAWRRLSAASLANGQVTQAQQAARQAADLFEWAGDAIGAAQSMQALGEALARDPHPGQRDAAEQALAARPPRCANAATPGAPP